MAALGTSFATALPPGWRGIDLLASDTGELLGEPMSDALALAASGADQARPLMLCSLVAFTEDGEPLAAGLSVMLADRAAPVSRAPLTARSFEGCEVSAVTLPLGSGLRVRHLAQADVLAGSAPLEVLRIQYLIHTVAGLLTVTFVTPQAPRTGAWELLFDAMATTCEVS
jgi:hypothetical protein